MGRGGGELRVCEDGGKRGLNKGEAKWDWGFGGNGL